MTNPPVKCNDANCFSILSLNLRFGRADDGPNSWPFRKKAYPALLRAYPSDFYAFQEANDFQVDFLSEQLIGYGIIGERRPAPDYWQSNVIYHHPRWRCLSHTHFYLSDTPDTPSQFKGSRWPRQCTMGTFQWRETVLTVINTHFDFDTGVQRRSAALIVGRLEKQLHPYPALLAGDFNAVPQSDAYKVFTSSTSGFRNVFEGAAYPGTYHGFGGAAEKEPIDWVLYRGPLILERANVISDRYEGIYPSDHFPLIAAFRRAP